MELNDPKPVTLAETQRLLAPDEALLAYLIGEEESYLWVVRRDQSAMQRLTITKEALTQAVSKLRKAFNKDDIRPFNLKLAHRLYSQLIAPAKPLLEGVQHIILKPDSALHSLPFAALITTPPKTTFVFAKRYPQLPWLGKEYAFTALPAVGSLKMLRVWPNRHWLTSRSRGSVRRYFRVTQAVSPRPLTRVPSAGYWRMSPTCSACRHCLRPQRNSKGWPTI